MQRRGNQDRPEIIKVPMQRHNTVGSIDAIALFKVSATGFLTIKDGGAASSIHRAQFSPALVAPVTRAWPRGNTTTTTMRRSVSIDQR